MRCLQLRLPFRQGQGLVWGPCSMGTPGHPDPRTAQLTACSEEMHVSLGKLLNGQFPRHRVGFSNRELPEGPRAPSGTAVSHPEWLCLQAPRPHTLVTSLLSASHTSVFKSPWLPQQRGVKGGHPAQRAAKGGLTFTGRGRGLGGSARPATRPVHRSLPAQTWSALPSARGPAQSTEAAAPSRGPNRPFPPGCGRRPGSSRPWERPIRV